MDGETRVRARWSMVRFLPRGGWSLPANTRGGPWALPHRALFRSARQQRLRLRVAIAGAVDGRRLDRDDAQGPLGLDVERVARRRRPEVELRAGRHLRIGRVRRPALDEDVRRVPRVVVEDEDARVAQRRRALIGQAQETEDRRPEEEVLSRALGKRLGPSLAVALEEVAGADAVEPVGV